MKHEKYIKWIATLQILADDPRALQGERDAARNRIDALKALLGPLSPEQESSYAEAYSSKAKYRPDDFEITNRIKIVEPYIYIFCSSFGKFSVRHDGERFTRYIMLGASPMLDAWISEAGVILLAENLTTRFLREADWLLRGFCEVLKGMLYHLKVEDLLNKSNCLLAGNGIPEPLGFSEQLEIVPGENGAAPDLTPERVFTKDDIETFLRESENKRAMLELETKRRESWKTGCLPTGYVPIDFHNPDALPS